MKTLRIMVLAALLSGCMAGQVNVQYDEKMQPISCHAEYVSVGRDVEAAAFNVCGASAKVKQSRVNVEALKTAVSAFGAALEAALAGGL